MLPPLLLIALHQRPADNRFRVRPSFPTSTTTKFRAELPFGVWWPCWCSLWRLS